MLRFSYLSRFSLIRAMLGDYHVRVTVMEDTTSGNGMAGPDQAPAPSPRDPMMRLMKHRKNDQSDASVEDQRVAAFFRIRPDMALAFRVSPDNVKGIASRAKEKLSFVNEGERAHFMSEALGVAEEKKSDREGRWKKTRVMGRLTDILKKAPNVSHALGVVPGSDPAAAAINAAEGEIGKISQNDQIAIRKVAPDAEIPEKPGDEPDNGLPDPFAAPSPYNK